MNRWQSIFVMLPMMWATATAQTLDPEIIKWGTLATEASDWGQVLKQMNAELVKQSGGTLVIRFYFGRDEQDLVSLLNNKQSDAVSMTTVGLGQVLPEIAVLQMPMLFSEYEEWDYVKENLTAEFVKRFDKAGYTFLGWADLGFIYLFSKERIRTQSDLQKTKVWAWTLDPLAKAIALAAGREPVLLPIESVLSALINGDVQTVYGPPLGCLVYQWHTQVKYMTDLRLNVGIGAAIMDKGRFERLSKEHQDLLLKIAKKYHEQLVDRIRQSNEESLRVLKQRGLQVTSVPHIEERKWRQVFVRIQNQFVGQLYEKDLLDQIRNLVKQYRSKNN
ncbi:TRAP transporter substrate-binding protein DctP [candidate division KSB1 bacterium]|nr:TRAP transporter substrate-binding protein DctP [candidate division KSB1 bacterium]TDI90151.1 MAG: hypothetical protein E2O77_08685 [Caldithrix sp.]